MTIVPLLKNRFLFIVFVGQLLFSQQISITKLKSGNTTDVLKQAELIFDVYYSYSDTLILDRKLTITQQNITLEEFHEILEIQNNVTIIPINKKLYALVFKISDTDLTALSEVVIKGYFINTIQKDSKKTVLKTFTSELLPGVVDFDLLRALQQLPGVKSPNQTASGLYVKGGGPDQNLILWNDVRIYHPGHLFGMISPMNPKMVDVVTYYDKGIIPKYGERISAIIEMKTTDSVSDVKADRLDLNMLYGDYYQKFSLKKDKLNLTYSFRKSIIPLIRTPTFKSYAEKVFQNTTFSFFDNNNKFDFWDASVVLQCNFNSKNKLLVSTTLIDNNLDYNNTIRDSIFQNQKMGIKNFGASLNWKSIFSSKLFSEFVIHYSDYAFDYNRQIDKSDGEDFFLKYNDVADMGLDFLFKYNFNSKLKFNGGYQLSNYKVSHLIRSYNQDFGFNITNKENSSYTNAVHFNSQYFVKNYEINMGTRISIYQNHKFLIEPRISFIYSFDKNLQGSLSFEKRSQMIHQINENKAGDISLENYIWVLSDGDELPVMTSNQFNFGLLYKKSRYAFALDFYLKKINGVSSFSEGFLFSETDVSNSISTLTSGFSLIEGFDISVQKQTRHWKIWTNFSFLNAKNKFESINNGNFFKSNGNIAHSFSISTSYKLSAFYLTMGWFWHSGRPYSTVDGNNNISSINTKKLADFHSLDWSALYDVVNNTKHQLKVGIAINNLYANKVIINREISRIYTNINDLTTPRYELRNYFSLGFTPNLFLKFSF